MKYFINTILLVLVFSCSADKKEVVVSNEKYDPILTPYLAIVDALSNDDYAKTKEVGEKIRDEKAEDGVKMAFKSMGRLISESSSLYDQRAILEQMAIVLQLYVEQELINDFYVYKFKCKNEFGDKEVFWYSLSKKSANPFIGGNSKECAELVETIKPVEHK